MKEDIPIKKVQDWARDNHIDITNKQYEDLKIRLEHDSREELLISKYLHGKTTRQEERELVDACLKLINLLRSKMRKASFDWENFK